MNAPPASHWIAPALAFALSSAVLALLMLSRRRLPHDHPSGRSLHERPVARIGGLAIWAGYVPALIVTDAASWTSTWILGWTAVAIVSIADDWRGVRPALRLAVHGAAALAVGAALLRQDAAPIASLRSFVAIAMIALLIVWSANLYNFMDGNDGLAGLMAIVGFGAYGVAAMKVDAAADPYFALAAASVPFLALNLPPARTFMGDGGSVPLGFLAAAFGLAGVRAGTWPSWFPLLVFLPFVADATVTVIRRIARRDHLFVAHKTHYYQRVHRLGAGHSGTLLLYGVLMVGTAASALCALAAEPVVGWAVLGGWAAAIGALFAGIDHLWRQRSPGPHDKNQ
jgi:UDP-N-acetylmuramyl pentapeptide phosphotransferase/UDP-N-acetylglucosamine-1-phosphate transferase